ncbi:MAG TPA: IS630 family transposase [Chromatiaceae bacterium]|nr:IS630 family transposase [Chromatiaceae bacterium]
MKNDLALPLTGWVTYLGLAKRGRRDYFYSLRPLFLERVGVSPQAVSGWIKKYKSGGFAALKARKRGPEVGQTRRLTSKQEDHLQKLITDKAPDQLKLSYALWTRKAVMELIKQETGIAMPIRTVGEYLRRWGFTPQKPVKPAYEQNPNAVQQWLDEEYSAIHARAKKEKAEIYWGDETGVRSDNQHERGYAPRGKTPVIRLNAKRSSTNMISAVTNPGKVRFRIFEGNMNADILIDFCQRLIKPAKRKIYLILDNLRVHHAKVFKAWLERYKEEIEVFYFPSYSPELNPDEYLNCDLKAGVHSGKPARDKKQLKKKVLSHMRMLQKKPGRVAKYFEHRKIRCAAA